MSCISGTASLTFASVGPAGVVHFARCDYCQTNACPGGWHTWANSQDVEQALATGHADPSGDICGCACAAGPVLEHEYPDQVQVEPEDVSIDMAPCDVCGATNACGYDADDQPWIHVTREDKS